MSSRKPVQNKRGSPDRRRQERRRTRRRLRPSPVPLDRRSGIDRRLENRRGEVRRVADTFIAKKKIFARERRKDQLPEGKR